MDLLYALELVYLQTDLFLEQLESFSLVGLQKPLKLLFLVPMTVLIDELQHTHRNDPVQHIHPLLLTFEWLFIKQSFKEAVGLFQSLHIDVKLVAFVFSLEEVDFVGIFIPDAEVLAFL